MDSNIFAVSENAGHSLICTKKMQVFEKSCQNSEI